MKTSSPPPPTKPVTVASFAELAEALPPRIIAEKRRLHDPAISGEERSRITERVAHHKLTLFAVKQAIAQLRDHS